jgi:hypothetical protein
MKKTTTMAIRAQVHIPYERDENATELLFDQPTTTIVAKHGPEKCPTLREKSFTQARFTYKKH